MRKLLNVKILFIFISSCTILSKSDMADETLFSINGDPTVADEFLYVYEKNNFNNDSIYTEKDVDAYFDLFVNFKLKVEAAKSAGIDTTRSFLDEFDSYKDQLIKPYLSETKEQERLVEEAYERMKYEIDASHILVTVAPDALPEDTAKAYQKILEVYEKAKSGEDFGMLAATYSEDPSAKSNKGRLGYFSAFQMVFAFEDAAYNTPVDSVSKIMRSRFGYHILKVHDKRPSSGKVKVSHIMLRVNPGGIDSVAVRNKIFEIYDQLLGGEDWNALCRKYSEDQRTKNSGGTLPFIGLKQINDAAFESVAFSLQEPGDISDPVKSGFGWHIIKLEEKQVLEPYEDIKSDLEQRVSKDDRSRLSRAAVIAKLKDQNNYKEISAVRDKMVLEADSSLLMGEWKVSNPSAFEKDTLFIINEKLYPANEVINEVEQRQKRRTGIDPSGYMNELIDQVVEESLLDYEEDQLIQNDREFRLLLNEYYEGILLFEIMNQQVWGKAVEDTVGLQQFFDDHQESYYWGERADAVLFSSSDPSVIESIKENIDEESIKLMEVVLDSDQKIDVLTDPSIDSLVNLFQKYDSTSISIILDEKAVQSALYSDLTTYFDNLGFTDISINTTESQELENKVRLEIQSKSKKSLEYLYNRESTLTLRVVEGLFEKGDNLLIDSLDWEEGTFELVNEDTYNLVVVHKILKEQPKKLTEIKGTAISDYQNYLEKNWIEELKSKNEIEINNKTLDRIKKSYHKKLNNPG